MASDGTTGQIPVASPVQGSQATSVKSQATSGKSLPQSGKAATSAGSARTSAAAVSAANAVTVGGIAAAAGAAAANAAANAANAANSSNESTQSATEPQSLVSQLNKYLNNSGRPDQFRVAPGDGNLIQQVNPSSGAIVGEFSAEEFPALARSVGASSLLIDSLA
jgi:hypothetical protein